MTTATQTLTDEDIQRAVLDELAWDAVVQPNEIGAAQRRDRRRADHRRRPGRPGHPQGNGTVVGRTPRGGAGRVVGARRDRRGETASWSNPDRPASGPVVDGVADPFELARQLRQVRVDARRARDHLLEQVGGGDRGPDRVGDLRGLMTPIAQCIRAIGTPQAENMVRFWTNLCGGRPTLLLIRCWVRGRSRSAHRGAGHASFPSCGHPTPRRSAPRCPRTRR